MTTVRAKQATAKAMADQEYPDAEMALLRALKSLRPAASHDSSGGGDGGCCCRHLRVYLPHQLDLDFVQNSTGSGILLRNPVHSLHLDNHMQPDEFVVASGNGNGITVGMPILYGEEQERLLALRTQGFSDHWHPYTQDWTMLKEKERRQETTTDEPFSTSYTPGTSQPPTAPAPCVSTSRTDEKEGSALPAVPSTEDALLTARSATSSGDSDGRTPATPVVATFMALPPPPLLSYPAYVSTIANISSSSPEHTLTPFVVPSSSSRTSIRPPPASVGGSLASSVEAISMPAAMQIFDNNKNDTPSAETTTTAAGTAARSATTANDDSPGAAWTTTTTTATTVTSATAHTTDNSTVRVEDAKLLRESRFWSLQSQEAHIGQLRRTFLFKRHHHHHSSSSSSGSAYNKKKTPATSTLTAAGSSASKRRKTESKTLSLAQMPAWKEHHSLPLPQLNERQEREWHVQRQRAQSVLKLWLENYRRSREAYWQHQLQNKRTKGCPAAATAKDYVFGAFASDEADGGPVEDTMRLCRLCRDENYRTVWFSRHECDTGASGVASGDDLMQCLECSFVGCAPSSSSAVSCQQVESNEHILQHFLTSSHSLGPCISTEVCVYV
jgi:hypothetical protein